LRNWKKWTGLTTFTQIPSIWWKDCENRSSRFWDSFAQFKKKINASKIYSPVGKCAEWAGKLAYFYGPIYFVALPFGNGLHYRNSNFKSLDRMNISTSYTILVTFRPETSEFTLLIIAPFVAIRQKSAYYAKYLRIFFTYLDLLYRFGRRICRDYFPSICLAVAQGTLLWQPVKYGRRSQTSRGTTFTLCFSIRQRIGRS